MIDDDFGSGNNITAYIGLQNEPLGDEPNISISFGISHRVFCIAFALSRMEKEREKQSKAKNKDSDKEKTIKIKLEKDECSQDDGNFEKTYIITDEDT